MVWWDFVGACLGSRDEQARGCMRITESAVRLNELWGG